MSTETKRSALSELLEAADGEALEGIVFGAWGWGMFPLHEDEAWEPGYLEPSPPPVPFDVRGRVLTTEEAAPLMEGWSLVGGFGAPNCYAVTAWTKSWVLWVTQYAGSTRITRAPRNPIAHHPSMRGG